VSSINAGNAARRLSQALGGTMASTQSQVSTLINRFSPSVANDFRTARTHVRKLFPKGYELVYDNYNAFGCGYSITKLNSGVLVSVVAYPRWVTLFFFHGKDLSDPAGLLRGSGARVRSVRLQPISLIRSKAVNDLLKQAIAHFKLELSVAPALSTSIKSIVKKQLSRRPAGKPARKSAAAPRGSRAA
jgi:hypothetical protein